MAKDMIKSRKELAGAYNDGPVPGNPARGFRKAAPYGSKGKTVDKDGALDDPEESVTTNRSSGSASYDGPAEGTRKPKRDARADRR